MSDAQAVIRINIEAAGAESGARRVNQAIGSVGNSSKVAGAANDNHAKSIDRLTRAMNDNVKAGGAVGKVVEDINSRSAAAIPVVGNLVSKLLSMGPIAAIVGAVALSVGALAVAAIKAAAQVETWKANLLTMTKSTEAADAAYRELVAFGNNTPFSTEQSVTGFIKMRALGLETSTAIMTSFGNTASAMGKDMAQIVEAVADATTGEFERLKEFGIKAKQEGDKVKFTFQGVTTTVGKNAAEIQKYIVGIGNTQFGGAMARQMATAQGAFSQFEDQIFNTLAAMGDGVLNKTVGKVVGAVSSGLDAITPLLSGIMDIVGGLLSVIVDVGGGLLSMFVGGTQGAGTFKTALDAVAVGAKFVGEWMAMAGKVIGSVMGFAGDIIGMVAGGIRSAFGSAFDWLMPATKSTGQSMGESLVGILRAAQFVAGQLPNIFKVALAELKAAFMQTGAALAAALTGDFSKFRKIDLSFNRTQKVAGAVMTGAGRVQQDQRGNRKWIDEAAGKTGKGNIDFAAMGKEKPSGDKKKDSGASEAEKRAKAEKEFWDTLKNEAATVALIGTKAEDYKKQLELQKILGRDLNDAETKRLVNATQLVRTNKFLADAAQAHLDAVNDAGISEELTKKRVAGLTKDQLEQERGVLEFRNKAQAQGVDLQSAAYQAAEKALRADLARVDANKLLNQQLDRATDLAEQYSATYRKGQADKQNAMDRAALEVGRANGTISEAVYKEINSGLARAALETANQFRDEFGQRIEALGGHFSGKFGSAINKLGGAIQGIALAASGKNFGGLGAIGGLMDVFGRKLDGSLNGLGDTFSKGVGSFGDKLFKKDTFAKPLSSMTDSFGDFKKSFGSMFGKGGDFMSGLGNILGNAAGGAQLGGAVGSMLGLNGTGSSLGGALGGALGGPLGSLAGSLIGGALGGLLKKAKWGTASIVNGQMTTRGNKQAYQDNASAAGTTIMSTLDNIASQLGADVGGYNVSLGQYKGKWRVSGSGKTGKLKGGDVQDFGKDGAEAALRAAISDAISDGAIMGVRASTNALLKAGSDIEAQLQKAVTFENVFKDLKSRLDPVGAAIDALGLEFKNLTKIFNEAGATSEEYAQLEQLRTLKLQDIIKEQTSGLRDILDKLNGEASGKSAMAMFTEDMDKFKSYQSDALAGKQVDQTAYSALVDKLLGNGQSIYGMNSKEYQSLIAELKSTTGGFLTNVENAFNGVNNGTDMSAALNSQTNAITANQTLQTDYLAQILQELKANGVGGVVTYIGGKSSYSAVNGKLQYN